MSKQKLFTIGHSTRSLDEFVELLRLHDVTAIADVRSQPYSRHTAHFNRETLKAVLGEIGIEYVFMGEELGARRSESCCYVDGQAKYTLIEATPLFQAGLERLRKGISKYRISLMCAEKDPVTCHRSILVAKALRADCDIQHIIAADNLESHNEAEQRLLRIWKMDGRDLFQEPEELLEDAYRKQAEEIAYVEKDFVNATEAGDAGD